MELYALIYLYAYIHMEAGGSSNALLVATVFQQTAPHWHGDSLHSELEGGPSGHQGPGTSWLLGHGVLRRRSFAQPSRPQDLERSRHSHPQSPRNHQETVCWLQTGQDSPQCRNNCTGVQIFGPKSCHLLVKHSINTLNYAVSYLLLWIEFWIFLHHVLNRVLISICKHSDVVL